MAAGEGFEPSQTESESGVLPLHKPARRENDYNRILAVCQVVCLNYYTQSGKNIRAEENLPVYKR